MRAKRIYVIAAAALLLSLVAFAGSVLQFALVAGEAAAQSSVRPPGDAAVLPDNGPVQINPGGSVRPPAPPTTTAPAAPGISRQIDAVPEQGATAGQTTLDQQGLNSDAAIWGMLRHGGEATVSIPDKKAAVLVQDEGIGWLTWRARGGPLQVNGGYAILAVIGLLVLFYLIRGRIRIESGPRGVTIQRFTGIERFAHWTLAVSFILLALSGLNLLYGRDWILPVVGKEAFASVTMAGKWVHNNVAWAFMLGLVMVFVMWVVHNLPSRVDLNWIAKGGGLFSKGVHPPAKKFNAGQKLIFWSVIILGASISLSGISLLFPYEAPLFAKTFAILNDVGLSQLFMGHALSTDLTAIEEMQYAQIWHTIVAFAMIFIVIAHIYIGSVGMEGAFDAMGTGEVDRNWAHEHHSLWVDEVDARRQRRSGDIEATPAE